MVKKNLSRRVLMAATIAGAILFGANAVSAEDVADWSGLKSALTSGSDIRLTNDITVTEKATFGSIANSIDMNGQTLSGSGTSGLGFNGGSLGLSGSGTFSGFSGDSGALTATSTPITAEVDSLVFSNNTSTSHGAGLYYKDQTGNLSTVFNADSIKFIDNKVLSTATSGSGAGIFVTGGNVTLNGTENIFTGNNMNATIASSRTYKVGGGAIANQSYANESTGDAINATMVIGNDNSTNTFSENSSTTNGGAIMNRAVDSDGDAYLTINGTTTFSGNTATKSGGAIYNIAQNDHTASVTLNGTSTFTSNTANMHGGAIYNLGTMTINNAVFGGYDEDTETSYGNTATYYGGAIYNYGSGATMTINNSAFTSNKTTSTSSSYSYGGAIMNLYGTMSVSETTIKGNKSVSGGGIYSYGTVNLTNTTFGENSASYGGAINSYAGTLNITGGSMESNSATTGGAIYAAASTTSNISDVTFTSNTATNAGAIYNKGTMTVGGTFTNNAATSWGGAIYNNGGSLIISDDTTFEGNNAGSVGGAIVNALGTSVITIGSDVSFKNNTAVTDGGAIGNYKGATIVSGTTFTSNKAQTGTNDENAIGGGAMSLGAESYISIANATFTSNESGYNGGAIGTRNALSADNSAATLDITGSTFTGNKATGTVTSTEGSTTLSGGYGGAIDNNFYNSVTKDGYVYVADSTFTSNEAINGGAIYNNGTADSAGNIAKMYIADSTFTSNTASSNGGAIYNAGTMTIADGSSFTGNTATIGGAIYNAGTITLGDDITFENNYASSDASVIYNYSGASITIGDNLTINNEDVTGDDCLIYNPYSGSVTIGDNAVFSNTDGDVIVSSNDWGAGRPQVSIGDNAVFQNIGGVGLDNWYMADSTVGKNATFNNVKLAIFNAQQSTATIGDGVVIQGSSRVDRGAIYNSSAFYIGATDDTTLLTFAGSATIQDNTTYGLVNRTGADVIFNGETTFNNNVVSGSTYNGGAIANVLDTTADVTSTITFNGISNFTNNSTIGNGGAIYNESLINFNDAANFSGNVSNVVYDSEGNITSSTANDIYNAGTINVNLASGKTISLEGGIDGSSGILNINTADSQTGTVDISGTLNNQTVALDYGELHLNTGSSVSDSTIAVGSSAVMNTINGVIVDYTDDSHKITLDDGATVKIDAALVQNTTGTADKYVSSSGAVKVTQINITSDLTDTNDYSIVQVADGSSSITTSVTKVYTSGNKYSIEAYNNDSLKLTRTGSGYLDDAVNDTTTASSETVDYNLTDDETFDSGDMTIENATFVINGNDKTISGADNASITIKNDSSLTVENTNFTDFDGSSGVLSNAGTLTVTNATFTGGGTTARSRAITNTGTFVSDPTTYADYTYYYGGAIANTGTATVLGDIFTNNIADEDDRSNPTDTYWGGGAIWNNGTFTLAADGSGNKPTFTGNKSYTDGGAIYNYGGTMTISDAVFTSNLATDDTSSYYGSGGAIYNNADLSVSGNAALTISNSEFNTNQANYHGGAICNTEGAKVVITDTSFTGNSARYGGALYNAGTTSNQGVMTVTGGSFTNNKAVVSMYSGGGAILNNNGTLTVDGTTFTGNESSWGGAIYSLGTLTVTNATFDSNTANVSGFDDNGNVGGAIANLWNADISDSTFTNNTANQGGAIFNRNKTLTVTDSTFTNNTATGLGGAIYNESTATILANAADVVFSGNTANGEDNDIYNAYSSAVLNLNAVSGHSITLGGGIAGTGTTYINSDVANETTHTGTVIFNGDVATAVDVVGGTLDNNATISGDVTVDSGAVLYSTAANLTGTTVTNAGTISLEGSALRDIAGAGTTVLTEAVNVDSNYTIAGTLDLNGQTLNMQDSDLSSSSPAYVYPIGSEPSSYQTLTVGSLAANSGSLKIDVDMTNNSGVATNSDKIVITDGTSNSGTLNLTSINVTDTADAGTYDDYVTYITTSGSGTLLGLTLDDSAVATTITSDHRSFTFSTGSTTGKLNVVVADIQDTIQDFIQGTLSDPTIATYSLTGDLTTAAALGTTARTSDTPDHLYIYLNDRTLNTATSTAGATVASGYTLDVSSPTTAGDMTGFDTALATVSGGTLNVSNVTFDSNTSSAINNAGTATINGSVFTSNTGTSDGTTSFGGAIYNSGTLTINGGTFTSNTADLGGAIFSTADLTINSTTTEGSVSISGNTATTGGSGILLYGNSSNQVTLYLNAVDDTNTISIADSIDGTYADININGSTTGKVTLGDITLADPDTSAVNGNIVIGGGTVTVESIEAKQLDLNGGTLTDTTNSIELVTLNTVSGTTLTSNNANIYATNGTNAGTITGSSTFNLNGTGTYTNSGLITNAITIAADGILTTAGVDDTTTPTSGVSGAIANSGTLNLTGGTLVSAITGSTGITNITGDVTTDASVTQSALNITDNAVLTNANGISINVATTTIKSGSTLNNQGKIVRTTGSTNNKIVIESGAVLNNGDSTATAYDSSISIGADIENSGTVTNYNGAVNTYSTVTNKSGGTFNNEQYGSIIGKFNNESGATLSNKGTMRGKVTNAGDITNSGTINTSTVTNNNGGTITNSGTIKGGTVVNNSGATITNTGSISSAITNSGTVNNYVVSGSTRTDGTISGAIVNNSGGTITTATSGLTTTSDITNDGTLVFNNTSDGTLGQNIAGSTTSSTGNVEIAASDGVTVGLNSKTITNNTITLTSGIFDITDGTNADLTAPASLIANGGTLSVQDGKYGSIILGTVNTDSAALKVNIDAQFTTGSRGTDNIFEGSSDKITGAVTTAANKIAINNILITADPVATEFKTQVADTASAGAVDVTATTLTGITSDAGSLLLSYDNTTGYLTGAHSDLENAITSSIANKMYSMSSAETIDGLTLGGTSLSITTNGYNITSTSNNNSKDGITIDANTQTLSITGTYASPNTSNTVISGFKTAIDNTNGGIINLTDVTMSGNTTDVINDGEGTYGVFLAGTNNIDTISDSAGTAAKGQTTISSGTSTIGSLIQKTVNILSSGTLNIDADKLVTTSGTANAGTLNLTGGTDSANTKTTASVITGTGTTNIEGHVTTGASVTQSALNITDNAVLTNANGISINVATTTVKDGGTLNNLGKIIRSTGSTNNKIVIESGATLNNGDSTATAYDSNISIGADIENSGTVNNYNGNVNTYSTVTNKSGGTFNNEELGYIVGKFNNESGSTLSNKGTMRGTVSNAGDITNSGTINTSTVTNNNGGTITNSGTIKGGTVANNAGATITNTGTISSAITNAGEDGTIVAAVLTTTASGITGGVTNDGIVNLNAGTSDDKGALGSAITNGTEGTGVTNVEGTVSTNGNDITQATVNVGVDSTGAEVTGSTLTNNATLTASTVNVKSENTLTNTDTISVDTALNNAGTLNNSADITVANTTSKDANLNNTGTINSTFASKIIADNMTNTGGTVNLTGAKVAIVYQAGDIKGIVNVLGTDASTDKSDLSITGTDPDFAGSLNVGNDTNNATLNLQAGNILEDAIVNVASGSVLNIDDTATSIAGTTGNASVVLNSDDTFAGDVTLASGNVTMKDVSYTTGATSTTAGGTNPYYEQTGGTLNLENASLTMENASLLSGGDMNVDSTSHFVSQSGAFSLSSLQNAGTVHSINGGYENHTFDNHLVGHTTNGDTQGDYTIDLYVRSNSNKNYDQFGSDTTSISAADSSLQGTINISDWAANGDLFGYDAPIDKNISLDNLFKGSVTAGHTINFTSTDKEVFTPIGWYKLNSTGGGNYSFDLVRYNEQAFRGQVTKIAQYQNQLMIDDMIFNHTMLDQGFKGNDYIVSNPNRLASSSDLYPPYQYSRKDGGLWVKMYGTFERLDMNQGLDVGNNAYGTIIGADFGLKQLRNGWSFMPTAYIAYNGAHQYWRGSGAYQNGAQAGFLGTWYKKDFMIGAMAYGGFYGNEMSTPRGNDSTINYFAGGSAKAAYNWKFHKDWSLQPNLLLAYNFFGQENWHTDFGQMGMMSGMLHGINLAPGLNLIWEKETFSIYATIQYMYNLNQSVGGRAGNVDMPRVSMDRGYLQYGLGINKRFSDRFSGYFQTVVRNVGRNGVGLQLGFQWQLGKGTSKKKSSKETKKTVIKKQ